MKNYVELIGLFIFGFSAETYLVLTIRPFSAYNRLVLIGCRGLVTL